MPVEPSRACGTEEVVEQHPGAVEEATPARDPAQREEELVEADQVRREPDEPGALGERLGDDPELVVLEVAQPAMDQSRRPRRCSACNVVLLDERRAEAPTGGIEERARADDSAADD